MGNLGGSEQDSDQSIDKKKFSSMVELYAIQTGHSYMDSIVALAEEHNIEMEDIAKFISPVIKNKLEAEAMHLNYLPRQSQLPI
jgi:hypothetical protein